MKYGRSFKSKFLIFLFICVIVVTVTYTFAILSIPDELTLVEKEKYLHLFSSPLLVSVKADNEKVLDIGASKNDQKPLSLRLNAPISLETFEAGNVHLKLKLFGLIPIRTMKVAVVPQKELVACGQTIGVKLKTQGVLVIGVADVENAAGARAYPARDGGLKIGDRIIKVNDHTIDEIETLIKEIDQSAGASLSVEYQRGAYTHLAQIKPVKAGMDNQYHIGLWVRDSMAGIGTLTFFDPATRAFGALGHGITDMDTGALIPIQEGTLVECSVIGIKKGKKGDPGELKGMFKEGDRKLGDVKDNTLCGIYGLLEVKAESTMQYKSFPIGVRSQVKEGPALILCNIDGKGVKEYAAEIQRVSRQSLKSSKGMVIRMTDPRLLQDTGGIIQGMSGSPIIQEDKLIGAVTHVLINDPTRGYGIFIEGMIENICDLSIEKNKKVG